MAAQTEGPPPGAKRIRQPLNCVSCRERKIRCDRSVPCSQCIRRGIADTCFIENRRGMSARRAKSKEPATEVSDIRARLDHVERMLGQQEKHEGHASVLGDVPEVPVLVHGAKTPAPVRQCEGNEEEAIARLEELALNGSTADYSRGSSGSPEDEPEAQPAEPRDLPGLLSSVDTGLLNIGTETPLGWGLGWAFGAALQEDEESRPSVDHLMKYCTTAPDRHRVLGIIVGSLPPKHIANRLLSVFDHRLKSLVYNVIHVPLLRAELDVFYGLSHKEKVQKLDAGDTGWLGIVLMVFVLSAQFMPADAASDPEFARHVSTKHIHLWLSATRSVLVLSDLLATKRVSVIQTVILLAFQSGHSSRTALVRIAIANAQALGIHRLGDKAHALKPDDPPEKVVNREIAIRVWWALIMFDWRVPLSDRTPYSVSPRQFNTPLPRNSNDEELLMRPLPAERPREQYSDVSFFLANIEHIKVVFEIKEKLNDLAMQQAMDDIPRKMPYDQVISYNKRLRQVVQESSHVFGLASLHHPSEVVEVQRWLLHLGLFNSLLYLHRPHIVCKRARFCCVELARSILSMKRDIRAHNELSRMLSLAILQTFPATLLLCLDMLQVPQHEPQRSTLRKEIIESLDELRTAELRQHGSKRVARIVEMLLAKEEAQWAVIQHQNGLLRPLPRNLIKTLECVAKSTNSPDFEWSSAVTAEDLAFHPEKEASTGLPVGYVPLEAPDPTDTFNYDIDSILNSLGKVTSINSSPVSSYTNTQLSPHSLSSQHTPPSIATTPHSQTSQGFSMTSNIPQVQMPGAFANGMQQVPVPSKEEVLSMPIIDQRMDVEMSQKNNDLWDWFLNQGALAENAQTPLDFSHSMFGNSTQIQAPMQTMPEPTSFPHQYPLYDTQTLNIQGDMKNGQEYSNMFGML
ncbi:hypothetical protein MCUN1_003523 [Malassezia cuniculi]|uniref:Zn(2)-C6 fungal-type domain-containing protein n=1 Tax=Malassezia cuniculi TaxID=948313 RepID=A0AAF0ETL8_9BASI|nr:hypothetical protein MCUN1_003523 [Malassezia cuniculi]